MYDLLAEGLLGAFDRLAWRLRPSTGHFLEWLRVIAKPPSGVELRAADGVQYTGVAVFERNRIVMMIALAAGQAVPTANPIPLGAAPSTQYSGGSPAYAPSRRLYEDDDPGDGWPPANDPFLHHRR
jgi:hypothetical protein